MAVGAALAAALLNIQIPALLGNVSEQSWFMWGLFYALDGLLRGGEGVEFHVPLVASMSHVSVWLSTHAALGAFALLNPS